MLAEELRRETARLVYDFRFRCTNQNARCGEIGTNVRSFCIIRLHDAWSRYCRELVVRSAACRPRSQTLGRLPRAAGVNQRGDVLGLVQKLYGRPTWWEPNWGRPGASIDAAKRVGIQNYAIVSAALGSTPSPFEDIRRVRNYVTHPGEDTASEFRSVVRLLGVTGRPTPEEFVSTTIPPGISVFESWVASIGLIAEAAAS
jgi:hypothetical protein